MSIQWQLRRGTTSAHSVFTGAPGEVTVDTDKNTVVVHDGVTVGGYPLTTIAYVDSSVSGLASEAWVNTAITSALVPYATETYVINAVSAVQAAIQDDFAETIGDPRYTQRSNNLSDLNDVSAARVNLGLGNVATRAIGVSASTDILDKGLLDTRFLQPLNNDNSFRNKIINGNFRIWQRGSSFSAAGYTADRWLTGSVGSSIAASRQTFNIGQSDVSGNPKFFYRAVVGSVTGAANFGILIQRIEDVATFAGKTATLSFWAKADATKDIAIEFFQSFGTGGSPSPAIYGIDSSKLNITNVWQKYTVTVDIPSILGKTLGTDGNDFLGISFWFDAGSDYNARSANLGHQSGTFDIALVQLEEGSIATPFETRFDGLEFALCQRYFEVYFGLLMSASQASSGYVNTGSWKVTKRSAPALSLTPQSGTGGTIGGGTDSWWQVNLHSTLAGVFIFADSEL